MQVGKSSSGLDNCLFFQYNVKVNGVWRSLVSRLVRVQEASGSNPDTPTIKKRTASAVLFFMVRVSKRDSNNLNATRMSVAGEACEPILNYTTLKKYSVMVSGLSFIPFSIHHLSVSTSVATM